MATNSTTYYNLPVFAASDKPKWLVDWNTTMNLIDSAIAAAKAAGDNAQITANANAVAITGLNESVSTMSTALGTLTTNVTTLTGNVQRINELIGNGTPTTQDKTIIGAINELKAAIDALAPGGAVQANEVEYNNTSSGLTADDVQEAIDELNTKIKNIPGGGGVDFNLVTNVQATATTTYTAETTDVNVLTNADSSVGKIYGGVDVSGSITIGAGAWQTITTLAASNLPAITTGYNINLGYGMGLVNNVWQPVVARLKFNTDGTVEAQIKGYTAQTTFARAFISLAPCIYFLKDLGD